MESRVRQEAGETPSNTWDGNQMEQPCSEKGGALLGCLLTGS